MRTSTRRALGPARKAWRAARWRRTRDAGTYALTATLNNAWTVSLVGGFITGLATGLLLRG